MKFSPLLLVAAFSPLAGCTYFSPDKQAEAAVSEFVSTGMNNRADYRAGRFDSQPFTRQDSLNYAAKVAALIAQQKPATFTDRSGRVLPPRYEQPAPPAATPTRKLDPKAQLGTFIRHTYSEQTRTGNVSRDSGEFVVYTNREVVPVIRGLVGKK